MAKQRTGRKAGGKTEHLAHWQQPWVKRVMQGGYSSFEKLLFMRVNSFGVSSCWMENETLAEDLGCCESYVTKAITKLWMGNELWITGWNNDSRKIYAAGNPEVKKMAAEWYQKERKAGKVKNWTEFYVKHNIRGVPASDDSTRQVVQESEAGSTIVRGSIVQESEANISKNRERNKEQELRRADSSSAADEQPNPPAIDVDGEDNLATMKEKVFGKKKPLRPPLTAAETQDRVKKGKAALKAADALAKKGAKQ